MYFSYPTLYGTTNENVHPGLCADPLYLYNLLTSLNAALTSLIPDMGIYADSLRF